MPGDRPVPYAFYPTIPDSDDEAEQSLRPGDLFRRRQRRDERQQTSQSSVVENVALGIGRVELGVERHVAAGPVAPAAAAAAAAGPAPVVNLGPSHLGEAAQMPTDQPWCRCGNCAQLPTGLERKCCYDESFQLTNLQDTQFQPEQQCVLTSRLLLNHILHEVTVQLRWLDQRRYLGFRGDDLLFQLMEPSNYRYHAYRSYVNFMHGHLGKGNRRVIPSCVVTHIRSSWPDPGGNYTGYREPPADDDEEEPQQIVYPDELQVVLEEYAADDRNL